MDPTVVLGALADENRLAVYRELDASARGLEAKELARCLRLHANTVRLHLDRLREAGLVEVAAVHRGTVGRPRHVYRLAPGAPGLVFGEPAQMLIAGLLASLTEEAGAGPDLAAATGRPWGAEAGRRARSGSCVESLAAEHDRLGFEPQLEPAVEAAGAGGSIAFLRCPFRELAEAHAAIVCNLHRGMCEGFVAEVGGGTVSEFTTMCDDPPCRVTIAARLPAGD